MLYFGELGHATVVGVHSKRSIAVVEIYMAVARVVKNPMHISISKEMIEPLLFI